MDDFVILYYAYNVIYYILYHTIGTCVFILYTFLESKGVTC